MDNDQTTFVRCLECGNVQADMGRGVVCEECEGSDLEPEETPS